MQRDRLENLGDTSALFLMYEIVHVGKFVFLTSGAEIVNAQGSDKDCYLTSWIKYTDTEPYHP